MTENTTYLALPLVAPWSVGVGGGLKVFLLPSLMTATTITTTLVVLMLRSVVVVDITPRVRVVGGDGCRKKRSLLRLELSFEIDELLVEICDGGCRITTFDLINQGLVIFRKTLYNRFNLVFMIL